MKHINTRLKLCDVDDAVFLPCVDSNLLGPDPDAGQRLPVVRLEAPLDSTQLKASRTAAGRRKSLWAGSGGPNPQKRLIPGRGIYKNLNASSRLLGRGKPPLR